MPHEGSVGDLHADSPFIMKLVLRGKVGLSFVFPPLDTTSAKIRPDQIG
jgi:hypothetical protein